MGLGRLGASLGDLGTALHGFVAACKGVGAALGRGFMWTPFGSYLPTSSEGPYEGILYYFWLV